MTDTASLGTVSNTDDNETDAKPSEEVDPEENDFPISGGGIREVKDGQKKLTLKVNFRNLASPRKAEKDKNEPSRFLGEGVSFKAKLIGILEVNEARGDRMCQEALSDLKMAIRAAGEHKQRITINIAIDGLRIRDEKTGDCLYHHPVHKISFIAQDMTDSRAFGYIFGSPDTGHRFFGIKTDKAASQVVIAMRDLFQVVFELKKKEIEMAKQHIEQQQIKFSGSTSSAKSETVSSSKNGAGALDQIASKMRTIKEDIKESGNIAASTKSAQQTSEVIADLLDLEIELNSIQQGIHQMEKITPSDPFGPVAAKEDPFGTDPFGDSFTPPFSATEAPAKNPFESIKFLPPPPSSKDSGRSDPFKTSSRARSQASHASDRYAALSEIKPPEAPVQDSWFDQDTDALFGESNLTPPANSTSQNEVINTSTDSTEKLDQLTPSQAKSPDPQSMQFDVFTELDPLGTGKIKPYVDKKDFFQDLKNPPKKVLKDLVGEKEKTTDSATIAPPQALAPLAKPESDISLFQSNFETGSNNLNVGGDGNTVSRDSSVVPTTQSDSVTSFSQLDLFKGVVTSQSNDVLSSTEPTNTSTSTNVVFTSTKSLEGDPFVENDPFAKTDPFADEDMNGTFQISAFPPVERDPFDTGFADFTMFGARKVEKSQSGEKSGSDSKRSSASPDSSSVPSSQSLYHGPLRVSLPPEKSCKSGSESPVATLLPPPPSSRHSSARTSPSPPPPGMITNSSETKSGSKSPRTHKQASLSEVVKLPSPKYSHKSKKFGRQMTVDVCKTSGFDTQPFPSLSPPPSDPRTRRPTTPPRLMKQNTIASVSKSNGSGLHGFGEDSVFSLTDSTEHIFSGTKLRLSSGEFGESAPEPPPRPATTKPPPLPPKRQQTGVISKPPPRPPVNDHPQYDYINNYESSSPPFGADLKSPPIPVPARRPRFGEFEGFGPQRPRRQHSSSGTKHTGAEPFPLLPPPKSQRAARGAAKVDPFADDIPTKAQAPVTTVSSLFQPSSSATITRGQKKIAHSLNITLSQLTRLGIPELSSMLNVSPDHLSKMTLQELAECLSEFSESVDKESFDRPAERGSVTSVTETSCDKEFVRKDSESKDVSGNVKRERYAALKESLDDESFKADFETNFASDSFPDKSDDVFQEAPFDKYAVFRELVEQEIVQETDDKLSAEEEEEASADAVEDDKKEALDAAADEDKYAALREISLVVGMKEKTDNEVVEEETADDISATPVKDEKKNEEEGADLLALSRQQSEETESSPPADVLPKETQGIIDNVIPEEDIDEVEAEAETEVMEESAKSDDVAGTPVKAEIEFEDKIKSELPADKQASTSSLAEAEEESIESPKEGKDDDKAETPAEGWAKFDAGFETPKKDVPEDETEMEVKDAANEKDSGALSWSSEAKGESPQSSTTWKETFEEESPVPRPKFDSKRRRMRRDAPWKDEEEFEEGWEQERRDEGWEEQPRRENGWRESDRESYEGPVERVYHEDGRSHRRESPWRRGQRSREVSPWSEREREIEKWDGPKRWKDVDEEEEEEEEEIEYERSWKCRPKRGSRDEGRRRRPSWDDERPEYDERRKRRVAPWGDDSRRHEFVQDEEMRHRSYGRGERRRRNWDEEYRRRDPSFEPDFDDRDYMWGDKGRKLGMQGRRKQDGHYGYYKERSQESSWEDEYGDQEENFDGTGRYQARKSSWQKRPSGSSDSRKTSEKSLPPEGYDFGDEYEKSEYKSRPDKHNFPSPRQESRESFPDRRYRTSSGDQVRRTWKDDHGFNSDQEHEYYYGRSHDRDLSYEQRSRTLHTGRAQKYRKSYGRPPSAEGYHPRSPFDDDFVSQSGETEFSFDFQNQGSDVGEGSKRKSPMTRKHFGIQTSPFSQGDAFAHKKEGNFPETGARSKEFPPTSPQEPPKNKESPTMGDVGKGRTSRGSSRRQSPFEDDFTPPETRHSSARLQSSVSSDVSDHRRSPYDDFKSSARVESVVEESGSAVNQKNGRNSIVKYASDEVFLPSDNGVEGANASDHKLPESVAFPDNSETSTPNVAESKHSNKKTSPWTEDKFEKPLPLKSRFSNLLRADSTSSLRKSESVNIFCRDSDPFDDDFFSEPAKAESASGSAARDRPKNSSDSFVWTEPFDTFNFQEEK